MPEIRPAFQTTSAQDKAGGEATGLLVQSVSDELVGQGFRIDFVAAGLHLAGECPHALSSGFAVGLQAGTNPAGKSGQLNPVRVQESQRTRASRSAGISNSFCVLRPMNIGRYAA